MTYDMTTCEVHGVHIYDRQSWHRLWNKWLLGIAAFKNAIQACKTGWTMLSKSTSLTSLLFCCCFVWQRLMRVYIRSTYVTDSCDVITLAALDTTNLSDLSDRYRGEFHFVNFIELLHQNRFYLSFQRMCAVAPIMFVFSSLCPLTNLWSLFRHCSWPVTGGTSNKKTSPEYDRLKFSRLRSRHALHRCLKSAQGSQSTGRDKPISRTPPTKSL